MKVWGFMNCNVKRPAYKTLNNFSMANNAQLTGTRPRIPTFGIENKLSL